MTKPKTFSIWKRKSKKKFTFAQRAQFHLIIMGCFLWGCICNYLSSFFLEDLLNDLTPALLGIGYGVIIYTGGRLFIGSDQPLWSMVGYSLIALPFSVVSAVIFGEEMNMLIQQVIFPTLLIIVVLGSINLITATFKIKPLINVGLALSLALILEFWIHSQAEVSFSFFQLFLVLFFAFRIGLYWSKARLIPPTNDNAIDVVGACVLDSLNPFYYKTLFEDSQKRKK